MTKPFYETEFKLVNEQKTGFVENIPSWINQNTNGSGQITHQRGCADLQVGADSVGDFCELTIPASGTPDVIICSVRYDLRDNANTPGGCEFSAGVATEFGDELGGANHIINGSDSRRETLLSTTDGGVTETFETVEGITPFTPIETEVIVDRTEGDSLTGTAYHRTQNCLRVNGVDVYTGASAFEGNVSLEQLDTSENRNVKIRSLSVATYEKLRP